MHEIIISKSFKKKYDKLSEKLKIRAKKLITQLEQELIGEVLTGDLKGFYSIHFEKNKYRIIYTRIKNTNQLLLVQIGKRNDSFYKNYKKN